ncbi:hypothetical protein D9M69_388270 [compost metagenome]
MNRAQRVALERALPAEVRDSVEVFVIDNQEVLDALRDFLEIASRDELASRHDLLLAEVNLKGGVDQLKILFQLAEENGLQWELPDSRSARFDMPGQNAHLIVRLNLDGDLN